MSKKNYNVYQTSESSCSYIVYIYYFMFCHKIPLIVSSRTEEEFLLFSTSGTAPFTVKQYRREKAALMPKTESSSSSCSVHGHVVLPQPISLLQCSYHCLQACTRLVYKNTYLFVLLNKFLLFVLLCCQVLSYPRVFMSVSTYW